MTDKESLTKEAKGAGRLIGHSLALILGLLLLMVALAMGVSLVLLPGGLVVGLAGFLFIVWGLYTNPQS
jgi:hypothetical protein